MRTPRTTTQTPSKRKPRRKGDWKPDFLEAFQRTQMVAEACRLAQIDRRAAYRARDTDPEFRAAWDDVEAQTLDLLETAAYRRAANGSDTLLIFLLKTRRPDRYAERLRPEQMEALRRETFEQVVGQLENEILQLPAREQRIVLKALARATSNAADQVVGQLPAPAS